MTARKEVWQCSVAWRWVLQFVRENDLDGLSTQDVVTQIVIPRTLEKQVRYVDLIPPNCVSSPTYFVSHVWGCPFLDLVASIQSALGLNEDDEKSAETFLWIDIFAVNQHRTNNEQASDLMSLHKAIQQSSAATLVCIDVNGKLLTR